MDSQYEDSIQRIRQFARDSRELQDASMDFDASATETRLEQTVRELQDHVREQQAALEKVTHLIHAQTSHWLTISSFARNQMPV